MQVNTFINLVTHLHDLSHKYMSMTRATSIDELIYFHHYKSLFKHCIIYIHIQTTITYSLLLPVHTLVTVCYIEKKVLFMMFLI